MFTFAETDGVQVALSLSLTFFSILCVFPHLGILRAILPLVDSWVNETVALLVC